MGKTTFAQLLAQALKKEFFLVTLGGISDNSLLSGANESSSGTEIGQLAKALIETKSCDPVILLDEIDKVGFYKGTSTIHSYLNTVLDPEQNKEIPDYYLDVKLDFSRATFIITVNDQDKIPEYLLSKTPVIVKLPGYNLEQKKEIANKFIQRLFNQNTSLDQNNFEITPEALEILINKTKEKGVRQLKSSIDSIFDYCLLQWAEEANQGKPESKIKVDFDLVHEIIPHDFFNVDLENETKNKSEKKQLEVLQRELEKLKGNKNEQIQLKAIKLNTLLVLRQFRKKLEEKEYQDYEGKINTASSREEIEVIEKEFLLKIKKKSVSSNPAKKKGENAKGELAGVEQKNKDLAKQLQLSNDDIAKLKKKIENLQKEEKIGVVKNNILFITVIATSMIWGTYVIFKGVKRKK